MKVVATTSNKQNQSRAVANNVSKQKNNSRDDSGFVDNRPETKALKSLQMMINDSPRMAAQRQRTSNIIGGKAQVLKGPDPQEANGPADSSKFMRLYAPSPNFPAQLKKGTDTNVPVGKAEKTKLISFAAPAPITVPGAVRKQNRESEAPRGYKKRSLGTNSGMKKTKRVKREGRSPQRQRGIVAWGPGNASTVQRKIYIGDEESALGTIRLNFILEDYVENNGDEEVLEALERNDARFPDIHELITYLSQPILKTKRMLESATTHSV